MDPDNPNAELEATLEHGQRRVDSATLGSPEWDAAQANVDAIEHRLDALRPPPISGGDHVVSRLGPMLLEDGCLIHGVVAALGPDGDALRREISGIPDRVHDRDGFVEQLKRMVEHADYILEIESGDQELSFYAWDRELRPSQPPPSE